MANINSRRGRAFEHKIYEYIIELAPALNAEWVEKDRYSKGVDIILHAFPEYLIDCKFTTGRFRPSLKLGLYKETKLRYGTPAIVILGQRYSKRCLDMRDITVLFWDKGRKLLCEVSLRDWLRYLVRLKEMKHAKESGPRKKSRR